MSSPKWVRAADDLNSGRSSQHSSERSSVPALYGSTDSEKSITGQVLFRCYSEYARRCEDFEPRIKVLHDKGVQTSLVTSDDQEENMYTMLLRAGVSADAVLFIQKNTKLIHGL